MLKGIRCSLKNSKHDAVRHIHYRQNDNECKIEIRINLALIWFGCRCIAVSLRATQGFGFAARVTRYARRHAEKFFLGLRALTFYFFLCGCQCAMQIWKTVS